MNIKQILLRLTENWPVKIICLVFAVFLSEFYRGTLLDKRYLIVPLTVENDGTLAPAEQYPAKIKVTVWGDATGIGSIGENDIIAFINISDFKTEGTYRIPIETRLAGTVTPLGNMEISTEPSILTLRLATSIRKQVPVMLSLKGIPADGYEVTESSLEPAAVEIEGPAELVEKINELVTEPLSIEARTNGFSGTASIINNNPLISIVGKAQVQSTVKINETTIQKKFDNIPIYFEKQHKELSIIADTKTGSLEIQGPKKLLETWIPSENILTVSCESITEQGVYTLPVVPVLSAEYSKLQILQVNPKSVQVTVEFTEVSEDDEMHR
ncbi:YbbR-like domain-containing protein [Treponema vincentii]|uniref:CdaR family protein n=1 Tax=Treponema vincentii TaxID=69710 RepID=UPI001BAF981B|nr:YbbR-like domain-containing protein [Treponema vincentii]QUY17996.1 YbbR-like domain-containing protein [Treponema vincentii]